MRKSNIIGSFLISVAVVGGMSVLGNRFEFLVFLTFFLMLWLGCYLLAQQINASKKDKEG